MLKTFRLWTVLGANALLVVAVLIFASGFFPYKAFLPGLAQWKPDRPRLIQSAPFDKVIFMVVDALRSDFVYGNESKFHFTQGLISSGAGLPFTGHASPPTITMPRVKAITTGSVPSFVDLVLNFAESDTTSTLATQDSWLAQLRAQARGKLIHYGDDTWLRLFPGFFDRADGTTSFFVSDFTEVDNNVTRHITAELQQDDWSVMTLHYLGLDHIGHKTGPKGPNMPSKQAEMDGIVKEIYEAIDSKPHLASTLLVLLGDHGMNEGGNHGASSAGEVSTALTFVSPKLKSMFSGTPCPSTDVTDYEYYDVVEQSDLAPTLAALLGFPVPRNNLGVIISSLLNLYTRFEDRYRLLYENAEQVGDIAMATFPKAFERPCFSDDPTDVEDLACLWSKIQNPYSTDVKNDQAFQDLNIFLHRAQRTLSRTASNYDTTKLLAGIAFAGAGLILSTISLHSTSTTSILDTSIFYIITISYGITMFASSYVEEEQMFWYWSISGYLYSLHCRSARFQASHNKKLTPSISLLLAILLFGITRRWIQTGQKYAGSPSLLTETVTPNPFLLWTIIIMTYSVFSRNLSRRAAEWMGSKQMGILPVFVALSAFIFKVAFTAADAPELTQGILILRPLISFVDKYPLLNLARLCFMGLAQLFGCAIYYEAPWKSPGNLHSFLTSFQDVFTLFILTQTRTVNIPVFLIFYIQSKLLENYTNNTSPSHASLSTLSILFQFSSFFILGGTNSISSIDLSNAYNGVGGYNVLAVGMLTFFSNWAGPIWWSVASFRMLVSQVVHSSRSISSSTANANPSSSTSTSVPSSNSLSKTNSKSSSTTQSISNSISGALAYHFTILTAFTVYSTTFTMLACYILREHLFIWTVFSPKYLYLLAWVFGQHLIVNGAGTGILLLMSRSHS